MIWLKLIRLAGSRILLTTGATLLPGATEEPGMGTFGSLVVKTVLFREVPTNLLLYFANQSTPNSSLLVSVNCPITVEFGVDWLDRKSTRLNSSHTVISYAVFCLKKKKKK